jgi:hypothetical protein
VINVADAHLDRRFNSSVDKETGYRTRSILCVPMKDHVTGQINGVLQVVNKNPLYPEFSEEDEVRVVVVVVLVVVVVVVAVVAAVVVVVVVVVSFFTVLLICFLLFSFVSPFLFLLFLSPFLSHRIS